MNQAPGCESVFLLYLLGCALHQKKADKEQLEMMAAWCRRADPDFSTDKVMKLAQFHMVGALAAWALDDPAYQIYVDLAMYRTVSFDLEREKILDAFENMGIWYLPLKGCELNSLYPVYGLREFSDNDVLADPDRIHDVVTFMTGRGYQSDDDLTLVPNPGAAHIGFLKAPFYNFEIHYKLFAEFFDPKVAAYYQDIRKWMIPDKGYRFRYHLSENDFNQLMVIHAFKHYHGAGTGLRTLLDFYIFTKASGEALNLETVRSEMGRLWPNGSLLRFERMVQSLSVKLLEKPEHISENVSALSGEERTFLQWMIRAGVYGTVPQSVQRAFTKEDIPRKITLPEYGRYFMNRMFSPKYVINFSRSHYGEEYPYLLSLFMRIGYAFGHLPECVRKVQEIVRPGKKVE